MNGLLQRVVSPRLLSELGGVLGIYAFRNADLEPKLRRAFALATEHGLPLDLHVDEGLDADATALACVAGLTLEYGLQDRVTCGHACSLAMQPRVRRAADTARGLRPGLISRVAA